MEGIWGGFGAQLVKYHPKCSALCQIWHPNGALWDSIWFLLGSFGALVGSNWGPKGGKRRPRRLQGVILGTLQKPQYSLVFWRVLELQADFVVPGDGLGRHLRYLLGALGSIFVVWEAPGNRLGFQCISGYPLGLPKV